MFKSKRFSVVRIRSPSDGPSSRPSPRGPRETLAVERPPPPPFPLLPWSRGLQSATRLCGRICFGICSGRVMYTEPPARGPLVPVSLTEGDASEVRPRRSTHRYLPASRGRGPVRCEMDRGLFSWARGPARVLTAGLWAGSAFGLP